MMIKEVLRVDDDEIPSGSAGIMIVMKATMRIWKYFQKSICKYITVCIQILVFRFSNQFKIINFEPHFRFRIGYLPYN